MTQNQSEQNTSHQDHVEHFWSMISQAKEKFKTLLDKSSNEAEIQHFLEQKPWLLCCVPDTPVLSQFPLGADYRCDFVFFSSSSFGDFIHLVEIESPGLQVF